MEHLISARFRVDSQADSMSESLSSSDISIETRSSNNNGVGNLYRHRLNKLVNALINLSHEATLSLAMNNPPGLCWFSDADSSHNYRTSIVRGVLGFGNEKYPKGAFLVQLGLYEERPLCNVILTTFDDLQNEALHKRWLEEAQGSTLHRDRVTIHLKTENEDGQPALPNIEITVSIRRISSASFGIRRFMLSITQKTVPTTSKGPSGSKIASTEQRLLDQLEIAPELV